MTASSHPNPEALPFKQVQHFFENTSGDVILVAPFIKASAFQKVLNTISGDALVTCYTRWLPADIASGVSDTSVLQITKNRPQSTLHLVDNLHAKLFLAGERCLIGSANITSKALGISDHQNLEVLAEISATQPEIEALLTQLKNTSRLATEDEANQVEILAQYLEELKISEPKDAPQWVPLSMQPSRAYEAYVNQTPRKNLQNADMECLADLAYLDIPGGLTREQFDNHIRSKLKHLQPVKNFLDSTDPNSKLESAQFTDLLDQTVAYRNVGSNRPHAWKALVKWLTHFIPNIYDRPAQDAEIIKGTVQ